MVVPERRGVVVPALGGSVVPAMGSTAGRILTMADRNLFSTALDEDMSAAAPLATRMRPADLDLIVGQRHLLGGQGALRLDVTSGSPGSMILFGPPGTGKTTVARAVAARLDAVFEELSAVSSGVADVRKVLERALHRREESGARTILFIDEIHRFSKAQQDSVLHAVEDGLVLLIGATTENPYFEVIPALVSRCELHRFFPLGHDDLRTLVDRALDPPGLLQGSVLYVPDEVRDMLTAAGSGDARRCLNLLERAAAHAAGEGLDTLDAATVERAAQRKVVVYDKDGDAHYDFASAFIKSMRGSDPDAALYYLAVMIAGGEDPMFIARRIVIFASEDVGNAEPHALQVAVAAAQAVAVVGLPEARINLAQAVTYLSCAPKSNASYVAIKEAMAEVESAGAHAPPASLRDTSYRGARSFGHGEGYLYPHAEGGYTAQRHLPDGVGEREYYRPTTEGAEAEMGEFLRRIRASRRRG